MVKLTWKDKVRKAFGFSLTDETVMAIAREEANRKAAEEARLEKIRVAKAAEEKRKAEAELAAKTAKKIEEIKAAAKPQTTEKPAVKKATTPASKKATPKKAVAFNPNAVDGDGDGLVQDGTIWERPAPKKKATPAKKKPTK